MLLDFTLNKYKELCDAFFGCKILIVAKYLSNKPSRGFIILRHDVDRILRNALRIVELEYERGARWWRFFGNLLLTFLNKVASGYWHLVDPQNGYTAISRRALERIDLDSIYPWYGYPNDMLIKLNVCGFRVIDVPHPARYGNEKSKITYGMYILKVSWLLLKGFFWRLNMKYIQMDKSNDRLNG